MDKWLWAARFFKTRALAARACELGRVQIADQPAKPAREVRIGDHLRITTDSGGAAATAHRVVAARRGCGARARRGALRDLLETLLDIGKL
mgnify:CR=1 FL=1